MAQKVRDYAKLAKDIIKAVGGEENIVNATHCATRLRLVLKETPKDAHQKVSAMPAVITVVENSGQFQVVIGTHVTDVYAVVAQELHLDSKQGDAAPEVKQGIGNRIIATMSAVFAPFVYILAAAGLIQGALIIITHFAPAFAETGTYQVLSFMSWTPFTFLPILIAITASKHFKCNTFIAVACCAALVNPDWGAIASRIADGETVKFLIFSLSETTYTSTVLPPLFLVLALAYLERFVHKHLPDVFKALGTPLICYLIMVPLTILIIGPISAGAANAIAVGYNALAHAVPALAGAVIGGFWQVVVIFGVHWGVTPMVMANFDNYGCDSFQAFQTAAVVAQVGAAFGVWLKSRNSELKNTAFSAGLTGIFGITEPTIYGVTLRLKKPFICACISGAVGAIVISFFNSVYYAYAGLPSLLTTVNAIGENPNSFTGEIIGCLVALVGAFILVQFIGFDDPVSANEAPAEAPASEAAPALAEGGSVSIACPMNGELKPLSAVNDPTFSGGVLGQGAAIIPSEGKLYAPCDGVVSSLFDTKHAIGITSKDGVELLMHIGLETVTLGGKHFTAKVKTDDTIKKGDLLIEFDLDAIKKAGFDTITPVLVVNADDYASIAPAAVSGNAKVGAELLTVTQ